MNFEGNAYCTDDARTHIHDYRSKELWRLDESEKILEVNYITALRGELPRDIDPKPDPNRIPTLYYKIYFRE
jgi:hypothetical protein